MDAQPKYRLETLDEILVELGCVAEQSKSDPIVRGWTNPSAAEQGAVPPIATFRPDDATLTIREDHAFAIAQTLRLPDPYSVIRLLKERGGEVL